MTKPRITASHHLLPFDRLSPADFERLCLWLVRREGYPQTQHLGAAGKDQGRDLAAETDDGEVVFQCKREKQFGPAKAAKAVKKILEDEDADEAAPPGKIILLVACGVTPATRCKASAAAGGIPCEIWPGTDLDERAKRHPDVVAEFFDLGDEPPEEEPPQPLEALLKIWLDRVLRLHSRLMPYFQEREAPLLEHVYVELQLDPDRLWGTAGANLKMRFDAQLLAHRLTIREVLDLEPAEHPWITRRWLLRGDPGSGKTTLLRHLAWTLADAGGEPWVPVFESLPRLMADKLSVFGRIEEDLDRADQPGAAIRELLEEEAKEGRLLLLLDGLDEVPREARERAEVLLSELAARWPKTPIVATTRPIGAWSPGPEFLELEVLPFDAERRRAFLGRWFGREGDPDIEKADSVAGTLEADRSLRELASNPLYLTLLALLIQGGEEPERHRSKLYDQIFELLEEGRQRRPPTPIDNRSVAHQGLRHLAYEMTWANRDSETLPELERRLLEAEGLRELLQAGWPKLRAYLMDVAEKTGILGPHAGADAPWRYWHRTFREALAAEALAERLGAQETGAGEADWQPLLDEARRVADEDAGRWAEPYALLAGRVEKPDALVKALVEANRPLGLRAVATAQGLREETLREILELTDEWEERQKVYERLPELTDDPHRVLALADQLRQRTRNGNDLFFLERAVVAVSQKWPEAGRAAAKLRQRFYDHLPAPSEELFRWIETPLDGRVELWRKIPAGRFLMGSPKSEPDYDEKKHPLGAFRSERPQHEVRISSPFWMAAVPVTVAQFAAFAPDHKPRFRGKVPEEELATHPVVVVTWYQAVAFCRWLSASLEWARGTRLPTEEEWEYACRAGTKTRYWSGNDESDLAVVDWYGENSGDRTHRVGEKPANPWGLYDVHGNVEESTLSEWTENYSGREDGIEADPRVDAADLAESSAPRRVIRGGCFWNDAWSARSAVRYSDDPGSVIWARGRGFRMCRSAAPE